MKPWDVKYWICMGGRVGVSLKGVIKGEDKVEWWAGDGG